MQIIHRDAFDIFPALAAGNAGIVHEAVETSEITLEAKREGEPLFFRRDVQAPVVTADFLCQLCARAIVKIGDNDESTFFGEAAGAGRAKAAGAAGYENSFPRHSTGPCLIRLQRSPPQLLRVGRKLY